MTDSYWTLRADWIIPVESDPIPDGMIELRGERVVSVGPVGGRACDLDLGRAVVLPGLINAHVHCDLDRLPPGSRGLESSKSQSRMDPIDWLPQVVVERGRTSAQQRQEIIARNVRDLTRFGTTGIGDISVAGASWPSIRDAPLRGTVYAEVIGLRRQRGLESDAEAWQWIESTDNSAEPCDCRVGLSPHAPYSTAGWLFHRAAGAGLPLSTHLAEFSEELSLLSEGTGRLREFLEELGAWDEEWEPLGPRSADYIRQNDLRECDWLVAHGTHLNSLDFWQFRPEAAPSGQRVGIVYCPRTHAFFGQSAHPYQEMLDRGIVVCLGTDSLASSPSLSLLDEMRFLRSKDPFIPGSRILRMATIHGAWALRLDDRVGSIAPGKIADLAVIDASDSNQTDPYELLLQGSGSVLGTMYKGEFVYGPKLAGP